MVFEGCLLKVAVVFPRKGEGCPEFLLGVLI